MSGDLVTWAALVAGITACIGMAKFWLDRGKAEASAQNAAITAAAVHGKVELLAMSLTNFRVEVAREYATQKALETSERQMTSAVNGVRAEIQGMNLRLDTLLQAMVTDRQ